MIDIQRELLEELKIIKELLQVLIKANCPDCKGKMVYYDSFGEIWDCANMIHEGGKEENEEA